MLGRYLIAEEAAQNIDSQHSEAADCLHRHNGLHALVQNRVAGVFVALYPRSNLQA